MLDPESGLYYYGGRYYDPDLGRFISPDPFVGQPRDPQSFNRYSYVENNPVNYIDPSGYKKKKKGGLFARIFGAIFGGIAFGLPGAIIGGLLGDTPGGRIFLAASFAVATYGAFAWIGSAYSGTAFAAAFSAKTAPVTGLSAASAAGIMEIPPVRRWLAKAGAGATIAFGLGLNMGFQLGYGAMVTDPATAVERQELTATQESQLQEVVAEGKSQSYLNNADPKPVTSKNVTSAIIDNAGTVRAGAATTNVGSLVGAHTDITGAIGGGFTLPSRPWYGYLLWGTSQQAANVTALQIGVRTTLFSIPGTGFTPYLSSFVYGPYGGGAAFNPAFHLPRDRGD